MRSDTVIVGHINRSYYLLTQIFTMCVGIDTKGFQGQRAKVKVISVQMCERYNGGGIHFDGLARLACFFLIFNARKRK